MTGAGRDVIAGEVMTPAGAAPAVRAVPANRTALYSSATPEWLTPADVCATVARVLGGGIDLDPCANGDVPGWTGAGLAYTAVDDGLSRGWCGRVYVNPPYGAAIVPWAGKVRAEVTARRAAAVVALVPARTDTRWWATLTTPGDRYFVAVVLLRGRLRFLRPEDARAALACGDDYSARAQVTAGRGEVAPFPSALVVAAPSFSALSPMLSELAAAASGGGGVVWFPWGGAYVGD